MTRANVCLVCKHAVDSHSGGIGYACSKCDCSMLVAKHLTIDKLEIAYFEGLNEGWSLAAKAIAEHDAHEAEMCGADCVSLGLTA